RAAAGSGWRARPARAVAFGSRSGACRRPQTVRSPAFRQRGSRPKAALRTEAEQGFIELIMGNPAQLPIRLLIADDDDQLRQTLVRRLERHGMVGTSAASGEEALAKTAQTRCDVALLDLHMPVMSGIELLDKLKERQPELEVLLLTAHGSIETAI